MNPHIIATCTIQPGMIWANGSRRYTTELPATDVGTFAEQAYRALGISYAKFFKMDPMGKLGILAAEQLAGPAHHAPANRHILLFGQTGSLLADWSHQQTMLDGRSVSPAVFVYTLPNIVVGELCIRHQFMGENGMFLTPAWQPHTALAMVNSLLEDDPDGLCLTGWIDVHGEGYEVFLCLVDSQPSVPGLPFNEATLQQLYSNPRHVADGISQPAEAAAWV